MHKRDFIKKLTARTQWSEEQVMSATNKILTHIKQKVRSGHGVEIRGFGSFFVQYRRGRHLRNPHNGQLVEVPAKRAPRFRVAKTLARKANKTQRAASSHNV